MRVVGSLIGVVVAVGWSQNGAPARLVIGNNPVWGPGARSFPVVIGLASAIVAIIAAYCYLVWKMTRYAITPTAVWYRSGILSRKQRHARLSRIQAVNLSYSLIGRIVGLGYLDVEVAGGSDSRIKLGLLSSRRLEEVRALVLALASGAIDEVVEPSESTRPASRGGVVGAAVPAAPERVVFQVSLPKLLASLLATLGNAIALLFASGCAC